MEKSNNPMGARRSLPLKIAGISCALLVAAILILSVLNLHSIVSVAIPAVVILIMAVLITLSV
jgi:hypothetical protein